MLEALMSRSVRLGEVSCCGAVSKVSIDWPLMTGGVSLNAGAAARDAAHGGFAAGSVSAAETAVAGLTRDLLALGEVTIGFAEGLVAKEDGRPPFDISRCASAAMAASSEPMSAIVDDGMADAFVMDEFKQVRVL
jgi:hypothetical protein